MDLPTTPFPSLRGSVTARCRRGTLTLGAVPIVSHKACPERVEGAAEERRGAEESGIPSPEFACSPGERADDARVIGGGCPSGGE